MPDEIILISDPRVSAVCVRECGEKLIDVEQVNPNYRVDSKRTDVQKISETILRITKF